MSHDLYLCPFCGEEPREQVDNRWPDGCGNHPVKGYTVVCDNIECPIYHADNTYFPTREAAAKAWNTRIGYDPMQAQIDSFMGDLKRGLGL